ncbi:MAG: type II secretion system F family protein [Kineosporiaceae bacterium]|nr:type II secretion system F family protein [Kineosporiaceae bacterium]
MDGGPSAVAAGVSIALAVLVARPGPAHLSHLSHLGRGAAAGPGRGAGTPGSTTSAAPHGTLTGSEVAVLADRVAALSRAGLPPDQLWRVLGERPGVPGYVARCLIAETSLGGTGADGLRRAARLLGAQGRADAHGRRALDWLATAWGVSERTGAPLARVLDGLAEAIRADLQAERERDAALAGPRATATVLSWLPLAGLGLGTLTDAGTLGVLFGTGAGRVCLVTGAVLWWIGRSWSHRLVRRADTAEPAQ